MQTDKDFKDCYSAMRPYTVVSQDRCRVLFDLAWRATRLTGVWFECGVYRGGTAMMLAKIIRESKSGIMLHLFDTFQGMPETDSRVDLHGKGDFGGVDIREVMERLGLISDDGDKSVVVHPGFIPDTFAELSSFKISFAHVDVDIYRSVLDCCKFIYPRLVPGGFLLFDDYGFRTCPGAKKAVDEYFNHVPEVPFVLSTKQALVTKRGGKTDG